MSQSKVILFSSLNLPKVDFKTLWPDMVYYFKFSNCFPQIQLCPFFDTFHQILNLIDIQNNCTKKMC